ncbi:MAG: hypothetical protein EOM69_02795 [Clostridia bacterium]|nr:hypothetical protein [Clostridia bacterium]
MKQICGDNAYVLQPAKHSYNELISAKHEIFERSQKIRNEKLFDCNMITISIRDNYNKVFIGIPTLEDNRVAKYLTDGIDFSLYEFYIASPPQQFGNYHPGDCIHGNIGGSTGYKAKLTIDGVEKIGFVTAAHVTNGSNAYTNWTHLVKIGNTIVEQNSGSVDAAFVELTGSHTFANQIDGYNITAGTSVIPAIGSTVYKIGTTTGTTSGTVISNINESWWDIDGVLVLFTNLCDTTVYCEGGDSGGLMYTKNGTTYKVIGNIKGGGNGVYSATKHSYLPWNISVIS